MNKVGNGTQHANPRNWQKNRRKKYADNGPAGKHPGQAAHFRIGACNIDRETKGRGTCGDNGVCRVHGVDHSGHVAS